jgi:hypothetical protein
MATPRATERLRVWVATGRWGARRVRTDECACVLRAEELYARLVKDERVDRAGEEGRVDVSIPAEGQVRHWAVTWHSRANRIWSRGRLFFACPRCSCRVARLYVPIPELRPECRRCWGLTYHSRARANYSPAVALGCDEYQ